MGGGGVLYGSSTFAVCKACDISISDMIRFLGLDREHMQQGIFPDVQQSYLLHSSIGFDEVIMIVDITLLYACQFHLS